MSDETVTVQLTLRDVDAIAAAIGLAQDDVAESWRYSPSSGDVYQARWLYLEDLKASIVRGTEVWLPSEPHSYWEA